MVKYTEKLAQAVEASDKKRVAFERDPQGENRFDSSGRSKKIRSESETASGSESYPTANASGVKRTIETNEEATSKRSHYETRQGEKRKNEVSVAEDSMVISLLTCCGDWSKLDGEHCVQEAIYEVNEYAAAADWRRNPEMPVAEETSSIDEVRQNFGTWEAFYDTLTGQELDTTEVTQAMQEEIHYMENIPVWNKIEWNEIPKGQKIILTKWVLVLKDLAVRARLVACEVKGGAES